MAFDNFFFPSQTTGYDTPSGSIRFNIHYDDGGGATNTNIDCGLLKLSALDMPFEIDPSNSTFRFPAITITFDNREYDSTNNFFEQYSILNETYKNQIFVDMYIGGSVFWQGIVDFAKIKRAEYYVDGSNLKYRRIAIKCYDRIAYFWFNPTLDLDDVSYADEQTIKVVFQNILAEINISSGNIDLDSNLKITEDCGNSYDMDDFKVIDFVGTELLKDFLKDYMLDFAAWIYSWNGKYYVVARNGGSTKSITNDYIKDIKKIENANPIEYIKVSDTLNWNDRCPSMSYSYTHESEAGDSTVDSNKQIIITTDDFLDRIFINLVSDPSNLYPSPAVNPTAGSDVYLEDTANQPSDFYTEEIETGMVLSYNNAVYFATIIEVPTDERVNFPDKNYSVNTGLPYDISRRPGNTGVEKTVVKVHKLVHMAAASYDDFFLTSPDIINIRLRDISEFINIHYKFVLFSNNHRIKSAKFYFDKDELMFDLVEVA